MKLTLKVIVIGFIAGFCGAYVLYYFGIKPSLQKVEGEANCSQFITGLMRALHLRCQVLHRLQHQFSRE